MVSWRWIIVIRRVLRRCSKPWKALFRRSPSICFWYRGTKNCASTNSQKIQERSNTSVSMRPSRRRRRFVQFRNMAIPRAVIFDLGGTLVHWADWETAADGRWAASYDHLVTQFADRRWPSRDAYVNAMRDAERDHWRRVNTEHWSGPPTGLVREAFDRLGVPVSGAEPLGAMDGYVKGVRGWLH